ncbi:hypothetical protein XJ28_27085 [Pseudomonas syringae pv. tomato]|nr:hypothetical protein XJ28_27085 [Pseudomonas syringae pv. tomato]
MLTRQPRHLSFLTLQRRNALGDALRHKLVPRCRLKTGRRASRTACDAERRTMVEIIVAHAPAQTPIVPHAPAQECLG